MVLGDQEIKHLIERGMMDSNVHVGPASVDIRLGNTFLTPKCDYDGVPLGGKVEYMHTRIADNDEFWLTPGAFVLATTLEWLKLPSDVAAFVQGRSSIGRAGLSIQNAGFVDPGFHGRITLELKNDAPNPLRLRPGYRIGQLVFIRCTDVEKPYDGKYNGQVEATGSKMHQD